MKHRLKFVLFSVLIFTFSPMLFSNIIVHAEADKSILEVKNNEAIAAYYETKDSYTASSYNLFKAAVDAYGNYMYVNTILSDPNVSQDTVDQMVQTIDSALSILVDRADNKTLLSIYDTLLETDLEGYRSSSVTAFENELNGIYLIITSNDLDQQMADQALVDLNNVHELLIPLPDFTNLQILVDEAKTYREDDYSISSFSALQTSISNAEYTINNPDSSQQDVDNMMTDLTNSINNLATKEKILYITQGQQEDINGYVTLGDTTVKSYSSSNPNIISIDNNGIITANDYGSSLISIELENGVVEKLNFKVKASVSTTTLALSIAIPFVGIGVGATIIFTNRMTWNNIVDKTKKVLTKKK